MDTKSFQIKASKVHEGKYDYSKVDYINDSTKVCIICPHHGEFWQMPKSHLHGHGCSKCSKKYKWNTDEWVEECNKIHKGKYDYSKVNYINNKTKVCIICQEHGEFWQMPSSHMYGKEGCPLCANRDNGLRKMKSTEQFVAEANVIHKGKYNYSNVMYKGIESKVCIICPEHGEFWQTPHNHLSSYRPQGCPKCGEIIKTKVQTKKEETFIQECKERYVENYIYDKIKYVNSVTKVKIGCLKHGYFEILPYNFLYMHGCPKCAASIMELKCISFFDKNKVKYEREKKFDWLKCHGNLRLDFYLIDYNIGIECQGIQHFIARDKFGGEEELVKLQYRDKIKKEQCLEHGILIEYINYNENIEERLDNIITKISKHE